MTPISPTVDGTLHPARPTAQDAARAASLAGYPLWPRIERSWILTIPGR